MTDLQRWLETATAGLPTAAAALTRAEIEAHYEDALADYLEQGLPQAEAHARTMADLGAADVTADGLCDVHRGRRHYAIATLLSLLTFFVIFVIPAQFFHAGYGEDSLPILAAYIMRGGLMIYVMLVFRWLLSWRFRIPAAIPPLNLLMAGLALETIGMVLAILITGTSNYADISRPLYQSETLIQLVLLVITQAGRVAASLGALRIGYLLARSESHLYGLRLPMAVLTTAMGLGLALAIGLPYFTMEGGLLITAFLLITHVLVWPALTLLFFRAAYRSPVHPAQVA
jgi:hypothetical protein